MAAAPPTLDFERELAGRGFAIVAGCDEVGRGSLAGPVSVGVVALAAGDAVELPGVKDSKLLRPAVREALVPEILSWASASAVGHSSAAEIDALGLVAALRLAGRRALEQVAAELVPDFVILDGNQDWLSEPAQHGFDVFATEEPTPPGPWQVQTRIKADLTCLSVAAASVLAKVERDGIMTALAAEYPAYGWDANMGYGSAAHRAAISQFGATEHHRRSWRLG